MAGRRRRHNGGQDLLMKGRGGVDDGGDGFYGGCCGDGCYGGCCGDGCYGNGCGSSYGGGVRLVVVNVVVVEWSGRSVEQRWKERPGNIYT